MPLPDGFLFHIAGRVFDTPLLISQGKLTDIMAFLGPRLYAGTQALSESGEPEDDYTTAPDGRVLPAPEGVAVIPILGTLVHRTNGFSGSSGLCSYQSIRSKFQQALNDPSIKTILLDIDSQGGEVAGCFDLVDEIFNARGKKPIVAHANEKSFSAAYAIASSADQVYLPSTAGVGSIGVLAVHMDQSKYDEKQGFKYTTFFKGARKDDFDPHYPVSPEAAQLIQERLSTLLNLFVTTVARNRGLKPEAIEAMEAGLFFGIDAVKAGLADAIRTNAEVMEAFGESMRKGGFFMATASKDLKTQEVMEDKVPPVDDPEKKDPAEDPDACNDGKKKKPATATAMVPPPAETAEAGTIRERERVTAILSECRPFAATLPSGFVEKLIADGVPLNQARKSVLNALAAASEATIIQSSHSAGFGANRKSPVVELAEKRAAEAAAAKGGK